MTSRGYAKRHVPTMRVRAFTIRFGVCLLVAGAMITAHQTGMFRTVEDQILSVFSSSEQWSDRLHATAELSIIGLMCLAPAIVWIEQPLIMTAFSSGVAFVYFLIASLLLLALDVALPITASFAGLFLGSAGVQLVAWSEERHKRTFLERLEQSKQQFTDMLVHDLKRRMSSILMSLSVLEKRAAEPDERSRDLMTTMRASAERMLLLTGNLLDVRRMEESQLPLHREATSLRDLVKESVRDVRSVSGLTKIDIHVNGKKDAFIQLDRGIFLRILANLLWNALQHAQKESEIDVTYGMHDARTAFVHIANHGVCIPPDQLAQIFTAFVSGENDPADSRAASTGLGLTFCKLAVEAHGGTIEIESPWLPHDDGVLVRILLPTAKK